MKEPPQSALFRLAADKGKPVPCAGNLPLDLSNPQMAWFIEKGAVDLFLVERKDGVQQSAPEHLLRAESGRLLPGVAPQAKETSFALTAKGLPGTVLRQLPVSDLGEIPHSELAANIDAWVTDMSAMLSRDVEYRPRFDELVEPDSTVEASKGTHSTRRGVAWVMALPHGAGLYLSLVDPAEAGRDPQRYIPLTPATWLDLVQESPLSTCSSELLARDGRLLPALADFHSLAFSLERLNRSLAVVDQANLERARVSNRREDEEVARRRLFNLYGLFKKDTDQAPGATLRDVLKVIGRHEGIEFKWPVKADGSDRDAYLRELLDGSGARGRRVRLASDEKWWIGDCGAVLAFREQDDRPVALLPRTLGRYREIDPSNGRSRRMSAERAAHLSPEAWMFYKPLGTGAVTIKDIFGLVKGGFAANLLRFIGIGVLGGLVMLLPAVLLGFIADEVIPSEETGLLYTITATLAGIAVVGALLQMLQGMALMRLEGRAASRIESAFWDRLLRLPSKSLRRFPAGNLATRGMTFQNLRDAVQGVVANAALSIVFLSPAVVLIYFYDSALGGIAAAFGLVSLMATIALGARQITPHTRVIQAVQSLVGHLLQLINGVSKLRVDGAEGSAFAVWARGYRDRKRAESQLGGAEEHLQAFGAALPLLAAAVLFLAATLPNRQALSVGDFLVIYTLFLLFQSAVVRLGGSFGAIAAIKPAVRQIEPFLAGSPEPSSEGEPVDYLGGEIVFDHVSFRYDPEGPLILDDVSIRVRPGEFIAIAGESGAGKSTLFRLAMGLDHPSSGAIYYDGRDLRRLNIKQLRRRIGAVPQEVRLHPEDVWDNIVGDYEEIDSRDAWAAAEAACVHREISAMPMGMMTCVGASVSVTSGGESQRIMIARSLIRKPRILLLDEATNWLDNESQAVVMDNLSMLTSTRVIIAHRLSTLRQADRIFVMQSGKVVQQGPYENLVAAEGVFRNLVRRQMI
ncbi:MAG: ATP-binding cassette domain-containing protein [Gammaproteobacteria bacterium]|nr:ATP-binding cassette domain-containing protein [Gammaproteobacteria bacterium]MCY3940782.1 ATP-binding cassette domain-containing protein [Gammaproteobacteria bacterium]